MTVEDTFVVEIKMPSLKNRVKGQDTLNNALGDLLSSLQSNFGTGNVNAAAAIAGVIMTAQIAANIASIGMDLGGLLDGEGFKEMLGVNPFKTALGGETMGGGRGLIEGPEGLWNWWMSPQTGEYEWIRDPSHGVCGFSREMTHDAILDSAFTGSLLESAKWEHAMDIAERHMAMLGIDPSSDEARSYIKELKRMWKLGSGR